MSDFLSSMHTEVDSKEVTRYKVIMVIINPWWFLQEGGGTRRSLIKTRRLLYWSYQVRIKHPLSEVTNILYLLHSGPSVFSLVDTITEGSWHLLIIYYWLTHYLFLLLLAQYTRLVTTAHEQCAMDVGAG